MQDKAQMHVTVIFPMHHRDRVTHVAKLHTDNYYQTVQHTNLPQNG